MRVFISPEQLIETQHEAIEKELQKYFNGYADVQTVFLDNVITHCQYTLAEKQLAGKPLSEEFLRGAKEILSTLENLKETTEKKRNGP